MTGPIYPGQQVGSQSTLALEQIDSSKYPDTNKDMTKNIERLNQFVDYIASYLQTMQKGVDSANEDTIQKIQSFGSSLAELFGGGSLLFGIDFGDLQYYLPAIGALLGFDSSEPFPINLLDAAENFFLGYVMPLDSFTSTVEDIADTFLEGLGFNANFIQALNNIVDAFGNLTQSAGDILTTLEGLFGALGITSGDLGPFSSLWGAISDLLGGFNISQLASGINPFLAEAAPWLNDIADTIDTLSSVLGMFDGGVGNVVGIFNFSQMFTSVVDFTDGDFNIAGAWTAIANDILDPLDIFLGPNSLLSANNLIGLLHDFNIPDVNLASLSNNTAPNLLVEPGFDDADSISTAAGWIWDSTTGHTTLGSAKATAGGVLRRLDSIPVPVKPGQVLNLGMWIFWANLSYTGTTLPITMNIVQNLGAVEGATVEVGGPASPAATSSGAWENFTAQYTVPSSGVDSVKLSFQVAAGASLGWAWFDDALLSKVADSIPQSWITELVPQLSGVIAFAQDLNDAIVSALGNIPVVGGDIAGTVLTLEAFFSGTQNTAATANSAVTTQSQQAIAKPNYIGNDSTVDATFPMANLTGSASQLIPVTSAYPIMSFIGPVPDNTTKMSICWLGENTTGLTGFYLNLYQLNVTTNLLERIESSGNILSVVNNALEWNYYDFVTPLNVAVGDEYAVEVWVTGTGTYQIAGEPVDWKPPNTQAAYPQTLGGYRMGNAAGAYDGTTHVGSTATISQLHTPAATDNYVVAWVMKAPSNSAPTVTYGGTAMTLLAAYNPYNQSSQGNLCAFGLSIPTGSAPATAIATLNGGTIDVAAIEVVSYPNIAGIGTPVYANGDGTGLSHTVTDAQPTQTIAHAFMNSSGTGADGALSAYNHVQHVNENVDDSTTWASSLIVGSSNATTSVTFSAVSSVSLDWCSIAIPLIPVISVPTAMPIYTGVVPWFGLGSALFSGPTEATFAVAGTYYYNIPNWMKYGDCIDAVVMSASGAGQGSSGVYFVGNGGGAGQWVLQTLIYGIDIPITTEVLEIVVGGGNAGGPGGTGAYGNPGSDSTVSGVGVTTIDAPGGPGGGQAGASTGGNQNGQSPGTKTFNGVTYTPAGSNGVGGLGAGAGGYGSSGQPGEVWMTAYQAGTSP